jgi:Acetyltransferase (GNAT) family
VVDTKFGWESVADLLTDPDFQGLIWAQFEELARFPRESPLDVDYERMKAQEKAGYFRVWAARRSGKLIGLIEFTIIPHLHYRGTLYAHEHGHYLLPEVRDIWLWSKMWRSALIALRKAGAVIVMAHDNEKRPLGPGFRRLGFERDGSYYAMRL